MVTAFALTEAIVGVRDPLGNATYQLQMRRARASVYWNLLFAVIMMAIWTYQLGCGLLFFGKPWTWSLLCATVLLADFGSVLLANPAPAYGFVSLLLLQLLVLYLTVLAGKRPNGFRR